MAWFIGQSIMMIAAAFLLGILVGWLIWGRAWRQKRAAATESEADKPAQAQTPIAAAAAAGAATTTPAEVAEPEPEPEPADEPEPEPADEPEPVAAEVSEPEPEPEPVMVGVSAETTPAIGLEPVVAQPVAAVATLEPEVTEDLERIEGIGPKMAKALHEAGIRTYAQLASAEQETLRQAIQSHGLRFAPSLVTWGRQAQLLADGDEEGFADLTRRLVAGRDEGRE